MHLTRKVGLLTTVIVVSLLVVLLLFPHNHLLPTNLPRNVVNDVLLHTEPSWSESTDIASTQDSSHLQMITSTQDLPRFQEDDQTRHVRQTVINPNYLSPLVINRIKYFVFFIGHARSGHSIVGAILDGHPHVVIAHEEDLFHKMVDEYKHLVKTQIFNVLWRNSKAAATEELQLNKKGYNLFINNSYQGAYQSHIDIIGDKRGGMTADMIAKDRDTWESVFHRLKTVIGLPMKVFHVIRNPYDNIATIILIKSQTTFHLMLKEMKLSNETYSCDPQLVDDEINDYFLLHQGIEDVIIKHKLDVIEVHGQDLISNSRKAISDMCDFLGVTCDSHFLKMSSDKVFMEESEMRYKLNWRHDQIRKIKENVKKFSNLQRYAESFNE